MTKLKALSVLQCREFVLETHGEAGIEAVKSAMSAPAREQVYSPLLVATDWIEVAHALEHALAYDAAFGTQTPLEAVERMISQLVVKHYNGMYRSVFGLATSPTAVMEKSSRLWRRFYDSGESHLQVLSPVSVLKRIVDCPDLPLRHEVLMLPYYETLLREWGARDVTARHTKCVARGAECCETLITWRGDASSQPSPVRRSIPG